MKIKIYSKTLAVSRHKQAYLEIASPLQVVLRVSVIDLEIGRVWYFAWRVKRIRSALSRRLEVVYCID
jgi:hypothetical protein